MFGVKLDEADCASLTEFKHLTEFFTRSLKEGSRRVDDRPHVLASPVDGAVVSLSCDMSSRGVLRQVKGIDYHVCDFLGLKSPPVIRMGTSTPSSNGTGTPGRTSAGPRGGGSNAGTPGQDVTGAEQDQDPVLGAKGTALFSAVLYLAPGDYHKFHSPTEWNASSRAHIAGQLLPVNPLVVKVVPSLFCANERVALIGAWSPARPPMHRSADCVAVSTESKECEESEGGQAGATGPGTAPACPLRTKEDLFFSYTAVGATNVGSIRINCEPGLVTNTYKHDWACSFSPGDAAAAALGMQQGMRGMDMRGMAMSMGPAQGLTRLDVVKSWSSMDLTRLTSSGTTSAGALTPGPSSQSSLVGEGVATASTSTASSPPSVRSQSLSPEQEAVDASAGSGPSSLPLPPPAAARPADARPHGLSLLRSTVHCVSAAQALERSAAMRRSASTSSMAPSPIVLPSRQMHVKQYPTPVTFDRGDEVGVFELGSTIVLVFEAPVDFKWTVREGDKIKMGQALGHLPPMRCACSGCRKAPEQSFEPLSPPPSTPGGGRSGRPTAVPTMATHKSPSSASASSTISEHFSMTALYSETTSRIVRAGAEEEEDSLAHAQAHAQGSNVRYGTAHRTTQGLQVRVQSSHATSGEGVVKPESGAWSDACATAAWAL